MADARSHSRRRRSLLRTAVAPLPAEPIVEPEAWRVAQFLNWQETTSFEPYIYALSSSKAGSTPTSNEAGRPWSIFSGLAAVKHLPTRYEFLAGKYLSKSTVFGIRDVSLGRQGWVFRFDRPHAPHHEFSHLNINPKFTGVADPHIPLPGGAVPVGEAATKVINVAGKVVLVAAVAVDSYRLGGAVYKDLQENETLGHRTAKTTASVASGWAGGFAGAAAGNSVGTIVGGAIGAAFGGIGAVPGAAIGSMVGCLLGGVTAGVGASTVAEVVVEKLRGNLQGVVSCTEEGHLVVKPSFPPENEEQEDEWLEILRVVACVALRGRHMSVVAYQPAHQVFSAEISNILQPESVKSEQRLFVTESIMSWPIVREVCGTPQFFFSALAMTPVPLPSDLATLRGCVEHNLPDTIVCEYVCMNSNGSALYWLNPQGGAEIALDLLAKQSPYLQVKTVV
ncbi:uncharacterized protein LOC135936220 [Cloeon dipterum]|uniref:uncharacterized protein LOC135936220 n=1 Tax=Cloeon dipterum TaxID=197152 RepID=UPI0032205190